MAESGHPQTRAGIIRRKRGLRKVTQQWRVREIIKLLEKKR